MPLRDLILHNFWLKLFSLIVASLIWIYIRVQLQHDRERDRPTASLFAISADERTYKIPVNVLTQPADARVFKTTPREVTVTIRGERAVLAKISPGDIKVYVDLSEISHNEEQNVRLHFPNEISIRRVLPLSVRVEQVSP